MLYALLLINLITFIVFALDKWKATRHKRRIPESTLLVLTFLGGTFGAVCSMLIFRHKISKKSFLWKFGLSVLLQIIIVVGCWKIDIGSLNLSFRIPTTKT